MQPPYNSAVALLGFPRREMQRHVPTKTHAQMFTAASLVITPNWKQLCVQRMSSVVKQWWPIPPRGKLSNKKELMIRTDT